MQFEIIDHLIVAIAILFNLLIIGIMLSRPGGHNKLEHRLGLIIVLLVFPLSVMVCYNLYYQRPWWTIVLVALLIFFCLLEYLLDYVLKIRFRKSRWLGFYLLSFYLAQWGMIGYGFATNVVLGIMTLLTYFLSLGATAYSYHKVGHGENQPAV